MDEQLMDATKKHNRMTTCLFTSFFPPAAEPARGRTPAPRPTPSMTPPRSIVTSHRRPSPGSHQKNREARKERERQGRVRKMTASDDSPFLLCAEQRAARSRRTMMPSSSRAASSSRASSRAATTSRTEDNPQDLV